ncbi:MAG: hypothetical protein ACOYYS_16810 [Chloroflexota bacterium]
MAYKGVVMYKGCLHLFTCVAIFFTLTSCSDRQTEEATNFNDSRIQSFPSVSPSATSESVVSPPVDYLDSSCIPALETFSYPVSPDQAKPQYPGDGPMIMPISPWKMVFSPSRLTGHLGVLATRLVDGYTEIWLTQELYPYYSVDADKKSYQFMVYRPDTNTLKMVSAEVEGSKVYVYNLFAGNDGVLWGQNVWNMHSDVNERFALSKYNDETEQFEFAQNTQNIPNQWTDPSSSTLPPYWSEILLGESLFWILSHRDAIYSYDLRTHDIKRYIEIPDLVMSKPILAKDGSVYYAHSNPNNDTGLPIRSVEIVHFIPETNEVKNIPILLEPWPTSSSILEDHVGRLWLSSLGWREASGEWYQIHRSPLFITNMRVGHDSNRYSVFRNISGIRAEHTRT